MKEKIKEIGRTILPCLIFAIVGFLMLLAMANSGNAKVTKPPAEPVKAGASCQAGSNQVDINSLVAQIEELKKQNATLQTQLKVNNAFREMALKGLETKAALNMQGINLDELTDAERLRRYIGNPSVPNAQQPAQAQKKAEDDSAWEQFKNVGVGYAIIKILQAAGILVL